MSLAVAGEVCSCGRCPVPGMIVAAVEGAMRGAAGVGDLRDPCLPIVHRGAIVAGAAVAAWCVLAVHGALCGLPRWTVVGERFAVVRGGAAVVAAELVVRLVEVRGAVAEVAVLVERV